MKWITLGKSSHVSFKSVRLWKDCKESLLHGEFTLRCGVLRRGFLQFQLLENAFEVNGDSLQSFHKCTDLKETCDDFPQVIRFVLHGKQSGLHKLYIVHSNIHSSRVSNDNDERVHQRIVYRWTTKLWPALSK